MMTVSMCTESRGHTDPCAFSGNEAGILLLERVSNSTLLGFTPASSQDYRETDHRCTIA